MAQEGKYWQVQGLQRGLEVLRAINRRHRGVATIVQISDDTTLHRTTVKRLLETLRNAGFVRHLPASNSYGLTFHVRELSQGFRDEVWASQMAGPLLRKLTEKVLWSCGIATLEADHLIVRDSTYRNSPLSVHPTMLGERLPLLLTASGRAYLAFCPAHERKVLLETLRMRADEQGERARDRRYLRDVIVGIRACGFAINEGEWVLSDGFGAIAVPVRHGRRVLACLNIVFSRRSVSMKEAVARYSGELVRTARELENQFRSWHAAPASTKSDQSPASS